MNVFSLVSIIAFMIYLIIGLYAFNMERRSKLNQLFLAFCLSMSVWSFAYAFVYAGQDRDIWMKISAVGWCTFSSFVLHLALLFTENKYVKKTAVKLLLYIPSALFFYISVFLYREDRKPLGFIEHFFNIGDFIYHFTFLLASIILVLLWGSKSKSRRKRKQAGLIAASSLIPFLLNLLTQTILPALGITLLPLMGHIYSLIMILGIFYTMVKYRLFAIAPKLLVEELLQEMMDIVILLSEEGRIIRTNNYTEKLLGYSGNELQNKSLGLILQQEEFVSGLSNLSYGAGIYRLSEVYFKGRAGTDIPVSLSCSPIIDPYMRDIIGFVIVGQDISMVKRLEQEILDNKAAEEKIRYLAYHDSLTGLPNRKYFYEMLGKAVENASTGGQGFAVLFLDLDGLKYINDHLGHEVGDMVLCEVGKRSEAGISAPDIVARIGGDEFTFLIFDIFDYAEAQEIVDKLIDSVCRPVKLGGDDININASIGFSIFPHDGNNADMLVKKADNEMYTVKRRNKRQKMSLNI